MSNVEKYVEYLKAFDWFSNVGNEIPEHIYDGPTERVSSWEEAAKWSNARISSWCTIELGNLLTANVRSNAPDRLAKWNSVARENLPKVHDILRERILPKIPDSVREEVKLRIQSQLAAVLIEVSYSDCSSIVMMRKQFEIYEKGFFPCGWSVASPGVFPAESVIMVY